MSQDHLTEPKLLICDVRSTQISDHWASGISAFTKKLMSAYAHELASCQSKNKQVKLLLVGRGEAVGWVFDLMCQFPSLVSYASYEHSRFFESLRWRSRWASRTFKSFQPEETFIWLSPWNFDSPNHQSYQSKRILQVVHDLAPLRKDLGFRWWKRWMARRWLKNHQNFEKSLATVSPSIQKELEGPSLLLQPGVDEQFGAKTLVVNRSDVLKNRENLLKRFASNLSSQERHSTIQRSWLLMVGRNTKYKNFSLAQEALKDVVDQRGFSPLLIWIGSPRHYSGNFQPQWPICLNLHTVSNEAALREFYELSDCLLHPSLYEGFGLPLAEAFCSGLPLLCHQSLSAYDVLSTTAKNSDADLLLHSTQSFSSAEWGMKIDSLLKAIQDPTSSLSRIRNRFAQTPPRLILAELCGLNSEEFFTWRRSARLLLELAKDIPAETQKPHFASDKTLCRI
jgi:glycosyltransferase involved in cell wall biosynthesis